jgi:AcrR family transcriptional regulator
MATGPSRPYRGLTPEKRTEERRARVLAAGRECFADAVDGAPTVAQVCARAGLSKRHFYELYDDRLDLVLALHAEAVEWFRESLDEESDPTDPRAWLARLVPDLCARLLEDPLRAEVLVRVPVLYPSDQQHVAGIVVEGLVRRVRRVEGRPPASPQRVRRHAVGAVFAGRAVLVEWWLAPGGPRGGGVIRRCIDDVVSVSTAALSPVLP